MDMSLPEVNDTNQLLGVLEDVLDEIYDSSRATRLDLARAIKDGHSCYLGTLILKLYDKVPK